MKRHRVTVSRNGRTFLRLTVPSLAAALSASRSLFERWGWLGGVSVRISRNVSR